MTDTSPPVVLAIGEACIDVVRRDGSDTAHPGGSPLNVAVGVSRLGVSAALATRFAGDDRGEMLAAHAGGSGVTLTGGSQLAAKTSVATATIGLDGAAHYDFDFDWDWSDDIDFVPSVVHTGSIGAVMMPGGARVLDAIRRLRPHSLVTFDPNSRPALMGDRADAARIVDEYVRLADIVKASDEDLEWLYPHRTPIETALVWSRSGPALVVLTAGANGAGYPVAGVRYFHHNHIGSSSVVTGEDGVETARVVYKPFGEIVQSESPGEDAFRAKFTGKEWDREIGLYYY
ncbi:MAG: PfkB family carbohydrate kinase, partial [Microbacteriaceae bacterium]